MTQVIEPRIVVLLQPLGADRKAQRTISPPQTNNNGFITENGLGLVSESGSRFILESA